MSRRLRVRWATGPDHKPADGEALARLESIPGSDTVERYPGAGIPASALVWDDNAGTLTATPDKRPTNLTIRRIRLQLTIETADGRRARAFFDPRADAPFLEQEDTYRDLRAAIRLAWRMRTDGRPPGSGTVTDWERLVDAARECNTYPSAEQLALDLDIGQRTVERWASAGPLGDGRNGGMDAVRKAAGRQ